MKANMEVSITRVLAHEGGYSNDAADPGGPTKYGITIIDARLYWKKDATATDVARMPQSVAIDIYRSKYWAKMRCDELPSGVDYALFDYGVNSGVGRAGKVLRRLLNMKADVSTITDEVIAAARKRDPALLVSAICDERLRFLQSLRTWPNFGKGWGRRVKEVRAYAIVLAGQSGVTHTSSVEATTGKGTVAPPKAITKVVVGGSTSGGVVGAATLWDWVSAHPLETGALAIGGSIIVGGAVVALRRWHEHRAETPMPFLMAVPELAAA